MMLLLNHIYKLFCRNKSFLPSQNTLDYVVFLETLEPFLLLPMSVQWTVTLI